MTTQLLGLCAILAPSFLQLPPVRLLNLYAICMHIGTDICHIPIASYRMFMAATVSELPSRLAGQLPLTGSTTSTHSFCDLTASQGNAQDPPCCVGQGTPGLLMALLSARLKLPWLLAQSPAMFQAPLSSPPEAVTPDVKSQSGSGKPLCRVYAGVHGVHLNTQLGMPPCC